MIRSSVLSGALALGLSGCGGVSFSPSYVPEDVGARIMRDVKEKDALFLIEGMWTPQTATAMRDLQAKLAEKYNLTGAAVSGDGNCLVDYIIEAKKAGRRVYLGGFSMGDDAAEDVARKVSDRGYEIDCLILLDGTTAKKIAPKVKRVLHIRGTVPYSFRGRAYSQEDLENPNTELTVRSHPVGHLDIPVASEYDVDEEIRRGR